MTARGRTRDEGSIERGESPKRVDRERRWEGRMVRQVQTRGRKRKKTGGERFKGPVPRERSSQAAKNNSLRETLCMYQRRLNRVCPFLQWKIYERRYVISNYSLPPVLFIFPLLLPNIFTLPNFSTRSAQSLVLGLRSLGACLYLNYACGSR